MTWLILLILGIGILFILFKKSKADNDDIDGLIDKILAEEVPEMISGENGYASSNGIEIWYNHMRTTKHKKGVVLLVMGHSTNVLGWPNYFFEPFLEAGYDVIRFDNRGVGLSDWIRDWKRSNAYTLEDMAEDAIAVLDYLGIDKVHLIGASMGGMIAQRIAISHASYLSSLTSIMSSGFMEDPTLTLVPFKFKAGVAKLVAKYMVPPSKRNGLKFGVEMIRLLRNNPAYNLDKEYILRRLVYDYTKRKGFNVRATMQHTRAIKLSGSRYEELKSLAVPTLVIHGKNDPLVTFEHALQYAPLIPNAKTLYLEGMGHDLPEEHNEAMGSAILEFMEAHQSTEA